MGGRSNACTELTRLWLESRHGLLVRESIPVPVPYGQSDIDLVAVHPRDQYFALPNGRQVGPRLIVETKDEHDWDPQGKEFGKLLISDVTRLNAEGYIPAGTKNVKFSMLRQQHFEKAAHLFGLHDFDRLFVVHAIDQESFAAVSEVLDHIGFIGSRFGTRCRSPRLVPDASPPLRPPILDDWRPPPSARWVLRSRSSTSRDHPDPCRQ